MKKQGGAKTMSEAQSSLRKTAEVMEGKMLEKVSMTTDSAQRAKEEANLVVTAAALNMWKEGIKIMRREMKKLDEFTRDPSKQLGLVKTMTDLKRCVDAAANCVGIFAGLIEKDRQKDAAVIAKEDMLRNIAEVTNRIPNTDDTAYN